METTAALPCRAGGARQRGECNQVPVASAIALGLSASSLSFLSSRATLTDKRLTEPATLLPFGNAESPKAARKEASG